MIAASPEEIAIIRAIAATYAPDYKVLVFGSRVAESCKPYSDIDLALVGEKPIDYALLGQMREAFALSDLPYRVDLVDFQTLSPSFRAIVEARSESI